MSVDWYQLANKENVLASVRMVRVTLSRKLLILIAIDLEKVLVR